MQRRPRAHSRPEVRHCRQHQAVLHVCIFSPDSQELYAGSKSGDISTFNTRGASSGPGLRAARARRRCSCPWTGAGTISSAAATAASGVFSPHKPPTVLDALDYVWEFEGGVTSMSTVNDEGSRSGNPKMVVCTAVAGVRRIRQATKAGVANPTPVLARGVARRRHIPGAVHPGAWRGFRRSGTQSARELVHAGGGELRQRRGAQGLEPQPALGLHDEDKGQVLRDGADVRVRLRSDVHDRVGGRPRAGA